MMGCGYKGCVSPELEMLGGWEEGSRCRKDEGGNETRKSLKESSTIQVNT